MRPPHMFDQDLWVSLGAVNEGGKEMVSSSEVISGNDAFWAKAYSENFATLCARATRRLTHGNSFDAEDAVSEAFARAMRYAQHPESIRSVLPYLWTVVKNVWTAQQGRLSTARTDNLEDLDIEELESLPAVQVEPEVLAIFKKEDFLLGLQMKLGPISLEEKEMIELRLEGYSLNEIAEQLGEDIRRTTFRWYNFTARQRHRFVQRQGEGQTVA